MAKREREERESDKSKMSENWQDDDAAILKVTRKAPFFAFVHLSMEDSLLTNLFSSQASRQFDQEGRKKFFTLDMNNILLE